MNSQFVCIRGNLAELQMNLNVFSKNDHVGEREKLNLTVKERFRGIYNTKPLLKCPEG